jgi:hypothetical protein
MENKASDRDSQWRQCSLLLGGVGVALSSFSSMIWLPSLLALIDCFLFSHLTGCEDLFNGRPTAHITPMNLISRSFCRASVCSPLWMYPTFGGCVSETLSQPLLPKQPPAKYSGGSYFTIWP